MTSEDKKVVNSVDDDQWISIEDVARMLGLNKQYAGASIRKGFLKGRISYRSYSGRNYTYKLSDVKKLLDHATIPAKK